MTELLALAPLLPAILPMAMPLLQMLLTPHPKKAIAGPFSGMGRRRAPAGFAQKMALARAAAAAKRAAGGRAHRVAGHTRRLGNGRVVHVRSHVKGSGLSVMNKLPLLSRGHNYRHGGARRAPVRRGRGSTGLPIGKLFDGLPGIGPLIGELLSGNMGLGRRRLMTGKGLSVMNKLPLLSRAHKYRMGSGRRRAPMRRAPAHSGMGRRIHPVRRGKGILSALAKGIPFVGPALAEMISENMGMGRRRRAPARGGRRRNRRTPAPRGGRAVGIKGHSARAHVRHLAGGRIVHVKGHRRGGLLFPA